jgi:hypothetical protein
VNVGVSLWRSVTTGGLTTVRAQRRELANAKSGR